MLKFRVWNSKIKRFRTIPQENVGNRCAHWCMKTEQDKFCVYSLEDTDIHVFQQFTGLKDKNEKEIYVGDVVSCSLEQMMKNNTPIIYSKDYKAVVKYNAPLFILKGINDSVPIFWTGVEIIGNIFENIELLEIKEL